MSEEDKRQHCWRQFLGAVNAYIECGDRQPGLDLLAEIKFLHGEEVAEQAKKEMNNRILKRKK